MDAAFAQNKAFFALPTEEKLKIASDKNFRGYTPMKVRRGGSYRANNLPALSCIPPNQRRRVLLCAFLHESLYRSSPKSTGCNIRGIAE